MSTADADGYGTASVLLAAERGLDLSLTAGTAWSFPRFPAGGRAPDRFVLRGSVNTATVELLAIAFELRFAVAHHASGTRRDAQQGCGTLSSWLTNGAI